MTHGSLFSGIGGFDLAAEWMGWENVFHCEINQFGQYILKDHYPNSILHENIKTTDFTVYRGKIDVLTGGFPCQPYSLAGMRKGTEDERHLWPEMLRAIREIKPRWIVGENVLGIVSWNDGMVFEEVQADLEAEGYQVQPYVLPAAGVDAPHKRDRVWFVAYRGGKSRKQEVNGREEYCKGRQSVRDYNSSNGRKQPVTNPTGNRWFRIRKRIAFKNGKPGPGNSRELAGRFEGLRTHRDVADTDNVRSQESRYSREWRTGFKNCNSSSNATNPDSIERCKGRLYQNRPQEAKRYTGTFDPWTNRDYWRNFPTQSPVCTGDDGFSTELLRQRIRKDSMGYLSEKEIDKIISKTYTAWRTEAIKAAGNAIVHQVVIQIFKSIQQYETLTPHRQG